jgi:uncharacterized PurR-regulated membrane protein YhhQ (DUF165 family)
MRTPKKPVSPDAKAVMKNYHKEKAKKYGMSYIEPTQPKWFVSYPFMIAIMASVQVLNTLYGRRFTDFFGFTIGAGPLILVPILLYIFQITSECYGWQYVRQIIWCNFIVNGIITIVTFSFQYLPYSLFNHGDLQSSYTRLVDTMWVSAAMGWVCIFMADYVTSTLMCASRFQWNGRFMMIRMIMLHCVGESVLLSGYLVTMPFNGYSMPSTLNVMWQTFVARTIMSIILLPVARFVIWFIQHKLEKVVVFDFRNNFNPFKFGINPTDSVHFNADGWDKIDSGKINLKKMAEYYNNGILEEQHQKLVDSIDSRNPEFKAKHNDDHKI